MKTLVSVVVPTYHRPQLLMRCLEALLAQDFPPEAFEIIVVDDGSEDGSARHMVNSLQNRADANLAFRSPAPLPQVPVTGIPLQHDPFRAFFQVDPLPARPPRLRYLPALHTTGPAAARNLGWHSADGSIIAFTDDDCIPAADWLARGVAALKQGAEAVSGRVIVPLPADPTDNDRNTTGLEHSDFVTANCFYLRDVLEDVGGFDERFSTAWREDSDLYFTVRERQYVLSWAKDAIVVHPVRPEPWGSSIRQQRKSFYNALLYKKHPLLYRRFIQAAPPWHYYAMLAATITAAASFAAGFSLLTAAALLVWNIFYLRFCWQRLKSTSHKASHIMEMMVTSMIIPYLSVYWRLRGALHWKVFFF